MPLWMTTSRLRTRHLLLTLAAVFLLAAAGPARAQSDESFGTAGTREGSFLETDSALGTLSIGVSGLSESERRQSTIGDLEFGYVRLYELDEMFPRVVELRPFALNRFESTQDSTYQSLGMGGGIRFALREKYAKNYWFARSSVLTPSDYYNSVYNPDRQQQSIIEFFVGIEVPFDEPRTDRDIRMRTLAPTPITIRIEPTLFRERSAQGMDPVALHQQHVAIISAYLDAVLSDYLTGITHPQITMRDPWDVIRLLIRLTDLELTDLDKDVIYRGRIDGEDGRAYRRELTARTLRHGLTQLMRGPYPLLLAPSKDITGENDSATGTQTTAMLTRPGMTFGRGAAGALNCDAMIDAYIKRFLERNVKP